MYRWLAAYALVLVAACADPHARTRAAHQRVDSWIATARFVADAWLGGAVPGRYAANTLDEARRAIRDAEADLRRRADVPSPLPDAFARAADAVGGLAAAVRHDDRDAVRRDRQTLDAVAVAGR